MTKRKRFRLWRERHTVLSPLVFLLVGVMLTGTAYAAWLIDQSSTVGKGATGSLIAPTVTAGTAAAGAQAYPGVPGDLTFHVVNPNAVAVHVTGWVNAPTQTDPSFANSVTGMGACSNSNFGSYDNTGSTDLPGTFTPNPGYSAGTGVTLSAPQQTAATIPANANADITIPAMFVLDREAPSTCQGLAALVFTGTPNDFVLHFSTP